MIEVRQAENSGRYDFGTTARAVVVLEDGRQLGCAGVYLSGAAYLMFSEIPPENRKRVRLIIRAWRMLIGMVRYRGIPIQAIADKNIEGAPAFLEHLGFKRIAGSTFEWNPNHG